MATFDVLLPVRNGMPFLAESIESIRAQAFRDWRLLVLDHGSTDGSAELAASFAAKDRRIELHALPEAEGLAGLLNAGLEKCDARFVLRQDADDLSLPHRMDVVKAAFDENPLLLTVGGEARVIDRDGRPGGLLRVPCEAPAVAVASFFCNPVLHPAVTMNLAALRRLDAAYGRDILRAVPPQDSIAVNGLAEDYLLFGQLAQIGPCINLRRPLIKYRIHGGSVSVANAQRQIALSLAVSRFLARSFAARTGVPAFDPTPFCNHADYVFDLADDDHTQAYRRMAAALRKGFGPSAALERELAFRWVLATRNDIRMLRRHVAFEMKHGATPAERRTVRNWLLRTWRGGKYVYRADALGA